jgi:hypothetical protein
MRGQHVQTEMTRHGNIVYYFRVGKGQRTRLPGWPGSPEFSQAFADATAASGVVPSPIRVMHLRNDCEWGHWQIHKDGIRWRRLRRTKCVSDARTQNPGAGTVTNTNDKSTT